MKLFPSIEQFRHVVRAVRDRAAFDDAPVPILHCSGTVKIHGTNAGIRRCEDRSLRYFSRSREIQVGNDNAGFCAAMSELADNVLQDLFDDLERDLKGEGPVTVFGEWCGPGIQKGVGVNLLPSKLFVIFAALRGDEWMDIRHLRLADSAGPHGIYSVYDFGEYAMVVDFSKPELSQNRLVEVTERVEALCPVAEFFGLEGIGEGVVWKPTSPEYSDSRYWFKVKGEKHSSSKVAKLVEVDVEAFRRKEELVAAVVTENRMAQGMALFLQEHDLELKNIGHFLRWVFNDVLKEERDRIEASGFKEKDLGKNIADVAKRYYLLKMGEKT